MDWPGIGLSRLVHAVVLWLTFSAAACAGTPRAEPPTVRMAYEEAVRGNVGGAESFREESRGIPGFAGVFAQGCDLVLRVTEPAPAIEDTARMRFARDLPSTEGCGGEVRVERARYDWARLVAWHQRLDLRGTPGVLAHAPNVLRNRVVVAVVDGAAAGRVRVALERAGVPADAALIALTGAVATRPPRYVLGVQARLGGAPGGVAGAAVTVLRPDGGVIFRGGTDPSGDVVVELERGGEYEVRVRAPAGYALAPGEPASKRVRVGPMDVEPDYAGFYFVVDR